MVCSLRGYQSLRYHAMCGNTGSDLACEQHCGIHPAGAQGVGPESRKWVFHPGNADKEFLMDVVVSAQLLKQQMDEQRA